MTVLKHLPVDRNSIQELHASRTPPHTLNTTQLGKQPAILLHNLTGSTYLHGEELWECSFRQYFCLEYHLYLILGEKIYERGQQNLHSQPFTVICDFKTSLHVHVGSTIQEICHNPLQCINGHTIISLFFITYCIRSAVNYVSILS